jgi:hypothetical protein
MFYDFLEIDSRVCGMNNSTRTKQESKSEYRWRLINIQRRCTDLEICDQTACAVGNMPEGSLYAAMQRLYMYV